MTSARYNRLLVPQVVLRSESSRLPSRRSHIGERVATQQHTEALRVAPLNGTPRRRHLDLVLPHGARSLRRFERPSQIPSSTLPAIVRWVGNLADLGLDFVSSNFLGAVYRAAHGLTLAPRVRHRRTSLTGRRQG